MKPQLLFEHLLAKQDLNPIQMREILHDCMNAQWTDLHMAVFLALLRMKGETIEELTTAAEVMREFSHSLDLGMEAIDIVGTGGDGKNTFNVSTAASFVVAACGIPVAKHGNRSVSSRSGSADLLEQAGIHLILNDAQAKACIKQCNIVFLFAPHYHPAMQHARAARQQLGIKTLFNLLGPLINPAKVKKQVVGVYSSAWLQPLATVLANTGSEHGVILNSQDGLDEISIAAPTEIVEYYQGNYKKWLFNPEEYGIKHANLDAVQVNSAQESLQLIHSVFDGIQSPARDMVLLNSAMAIYCAKDNLSFDKALNEAKSAIDKGKARQCFIRLQTFMQSQDSGKDNE